MGMEIFPSVKVVYPNDKATFTARAAAPPILWAYTNNVTVNSDFSLTVNSSGGNARSAQITQGGVGGVKFTIDNNCKPSGGGSFFIQLTASGVLGSVTFEISIQAAQIVVSKDSVTLETVSYTVQAGDTVELHLNGDVFRFYLNGELETETNTGAATFSYGADVFAQVFTPVVGSARIPAPEVIGNWDIGATGVSWSLSPSHGTLSTASESPTEYSGGTQPGTYMLIVKPQSSSSAFQEAQASILIPALTITGSNAITLQPGEKVRFKTNYDAAQTRLVSWSVISGGGSFSNDEFTAPTAPGTTVVRASYGNQRADITITIPAIVTPTQTAATPGEQLTFTTNMTGTINWTADYGTPTSGSGASFVWTAPNVAGLVAKIKADNGTFSKTIEIPVLLAFPYTDPALPLSWDRRKTVLVSRAEDRTRAARVKDKGALAFESFELSFKQRTTTELQTVHDFWDDHYPGKRFIFEDRLRDVRKVVYFDSDIRQEGNARCGIDYSFRIVEG